MSFKLSLALLALFFFSPKGIQAQSAKENKNSIYISYGNIITSDQISFSYERNILTKGNMKTGLKVNYGTYIRNNADYDTDAKVYKNHLSLSAVQLIRLFEVNAGVAYAQYKLAPGFDPDPNKDYSETLSGLELYANIGVRFEKNHFLFRAGVGTLELLYFGLGVRF